MLSVFATSKSLEIILLSSIKVMLVLEIPLSERNGLIFFQNLLLSKKFRVEFFSLSSVSLTFKANYFVSLFF